MTDREAMKLALEALVDFGWHIENCQQFPTWAEPKKHPPCTCGYDNAITALRQALEQPEQEPVAFYVYEWSNPDGRGVFRSFRADEHQFGRAPDSVIPVPAQPPKQEFVCSTGLCHYKHWVGLTDEEILEAAGIDGADTWVFETAYAIEAKLKEKNA